MLTACYSLVYLDGVVMNGSREPTEPFDINSIAPEQIEAMEFYAGAAETPASHPPRVEWWSGPRRALQPRTALAQEIAALVPEGSVSVSVRDEKRAEAPAGHLPRDGSGDGGIHHAADVKQTEVLRRIRQEEPTG